MLDDVNYYEVLGLEPRASFAEIKAAFHQLARRFHPDKGGADPELFSEIQQAWSILSDTDSKIRYDLSMRGSIEAFNALLRSAEEVTLTDFAYDREKEQYERACRCGEGFSVRMHNLAYPVLLVQCSGCSLNVKLVNNVLAEEDS